MNSSGAAACDKTTGGVVFDDSLALRRPPIRISDIWRAPFTDLPIREEILYQYLPLSPQMDLLEIGPGTGFTAFRLSRLVRKLTIVDVAAENVAFLSSSLNSVANLEFVCWDISAPGLSEKLNRQFDAVESIEVLEFVPDPAAAIHNMSKVLRPGGTLFLQFPNYEPDKSKGVTCFEKRADLDALLYAAGFANWELYQLKLRPFARWIYRNLHERPLNIYRSLQQRKRPVRPQTFDKVWTFRNRGKLGKYKSPVYIIWIILIAAMRLGGDCFTRTRLDKDIMDRNLLIVARR